MVKHGRAKVQVLARQVAQSRACQVSKEGAVVFGLFQFVYPGTMAFD